MVPAPAWPAHVAAPAQLTPMCAPTALPAHTPQQMQQAPARTALLDTSQVSCLFVSDMKDINILSFMLTRALLATQYTCCQLLRPCLCLSTINTCDMSYNSCDVYNTHSPDMPCPSPSCPQPAPAPTLAQPACPATSPTPATPSARAAPPAGSHPRTALPSASSALLGSMPTLPQPAPSVSPAQLGTTHTQVGRERKCESSSC
jgi:hypothetical protein